MATYWKLDGDQANLDFDGVTAGVEIAHPEHGIRELTINGTPAPVDPLGISFPQCVTTATQPPFECYTRGRDLIATYAQTPERAFRPQIYWSAIDDAPRAIEVIVSVQTSLLDSQPAVDVQSIVTTDQVWQLTDLDAGQFKPVEVVGRMAEISAGAGCFLCRLSDSDLSYVEMIPPSDLGTVRVTMDTEHQITLSHRLFTRSLEKGVILRGRHRIALVTSDGDTKAAAAGYRAFLAGRLPLTT